MKSDEEIKVDFDFIMSEFCRFALMSFDELRPHLKENAFREIEDAKGVRRMIGKAASQRLFNLTEETLEASPFARRVDRESAFRSVKAGFGRAFLHEDYKEPTGAEVRARLSEWIAIAGSDCGPQTHLIPCGIGIRSDEIIDLGRIRLMKRSRAWEGLAGAFDAYRSEAKDDDDLEARKRDFGIAEEYYSAFTDVAEVFVPSCNEAMSRTAAAEAMQAALDVVHVLAGAGYTSEMRGGGPPIRDRRGEIILDEERRVQIIWSTRWGGAHLGEEWWNWVVDPARRQMVAAITGALTMIVDRREPKLLAGRFLDGCAWFGDASREPSQAAAVVKYLTSMERLLWAGEQGPGVTKRISRRAAALCFTVDTWNMEELAGQVAKVYDLRSAILHGRISKTDPEVRKGLHLCERVSRDLLLTWLDRFGAGFEADVTIERMSAYLDGFVREAADDCRKHRALAGAGNDGG